VDAGISACAGESGPNTERVRPGNPALALRGKFEHGGREVTLPASTTVPRDPRISERIHTTTECAR
jgi:hypothetical protein